MLIVGRNGPCEGTDAVLAVPFSKTVEEERLYRTVVFDAVRLQEVSYILDAHTDVGNLDIERHAFLHAGINRLEVAHPRIVRAIFRKFHHAIVAELIAAFQIIDHLKDVCPASSCCCTLRFLVIAVSGIGASHHLSELLFGRFVPVVSAYVDESLLFAESHVAEFCCDGRDTGKQLVFFVCPIHLCFNHFFCCLLCRLAIEKLVIVECFQAVYGFRNSGRCQTVSGDAHRHRFAVVIR